MNLSSLLNEFPPVLCRLLVRPHQSNRQLATRAKWTTQPLTREQVDRISQLTKWDTVTMRDMRAFLFMCGFNLLLMRRHREFIRRANWSHITTPYQRRLFKLLVNSRTNAHSTQRT